MQGMSFPYLAKALLFLAETPGQVSFSQTKTTGCIRSDPSGSCSQNTGFHPLGFGPVPHPAAKQTCKHQNGSSSNVIRQRDPQAKNHLRELPFMNGNGIV
jgi:hypothetical protein